VDIMQFAQLHANTISEIHYIEVRWWHKPTCAAFVYYIVFSLV